MEGTTDNNLNDNRVREKEYEYLLRACANAVRENTANEGEKSEKWKEGTREKESVLLTALSRTAVCTNITFVEARGNPGSTDYSFRHLAQAK